MKKLIIICAAVGLMLISTSVSWAAPKVTPPPPPGCPWWNADETTGCQFYAYGYWEDDLIPYDTGNPTNDDTHWASNFLVNTDFMAGALASGTVYLNLKNEYREDFYKEIYIYIDGTTDDLVNPPTFRGGSNDGFYTYPIDTTTFTGSMSGTNNGDGTWSYMLSGEIIPQPSSVYLTFYVPGLTSVTNIWAGENCIPEPATICLLGLGGLALLRKKR